MAATSDTSEAPQRNFHEEIDAYISKMQALAAIANLQSSTQRLHPLFATLETLSRLRKAWITPQGLRVEKLGPNPQVVVRQLLHVLNALSVYGYDRMYWRADGYFEELEQNEANRKFIRSRLPHPEHYEATISELAYWGWLKARGLSPCLMEEEGKPDLLVGHDQTGDPVFCDVKAILPDTHPKRVEKVIKKANEQIKNVAGETTKGFCLIRIVSPVVRLPVISDTGQGNLWLKPEQGNRNPSGVPYEIAEFYDRAAKLLSSQNCRSVAKVVLTWEEQLVIGNIPGWVTIHGVRNSCQVDHANARQNITLDVDLLPKATIASNINLVPRL